MSAADIVGLVFRQLGRHWPPTSDQLPDTHAAVGPRRRRECRPADLTLAADVGLTIGKLDRQCRWPTLADTQADTQSVALV